MKDSGKRLRIAILGHFPVGDAPPTGGVQSVIANLRDELARRDDVELHLIQHRRSVPVGTFQREGWVEHNLPARENRIIPNMMRTPGLLRPLLADLQPDVVSTHQPEYAVVTLKLGLPTLHTIHGFPMHEFWTRRGVFTRTATLWEAWQERQTLRMARHLVAISDMVIQRYRHRTQATFYRINNPVARFFFQPAPEPVPGQLLLVGNMTPRKGMEVAIRAVQQLLPDFPHLQLTIVGRRANASYAQEIEALAAPLENAVRFLGPTDQAGIRRLLEASQALVLTSYEEHAPVIVGEAMASARPVVATRVGALAGMVRSGETGYLVEPGDVAGVAVALARLLSDPDHAMALGNRAARFARQYYHPTQVAEAYLQAMRQVLQSS